MHIKSSILFLTVAASLSFGSLGVAAETSAPAATTKAESGLSKTDKQFFKKAAQGGMAEVKLSLLAEQNSQSDHVKEFAKMMVTDHTKANKELMALAESKGVKLPSDPDKMHKKKFEELSALKGAEFDTAYHQAMLMDHEKTVALFEMQSKDGTDAEVKAFATKTLPTLKGHLDHVQKMAAK